jgi:hypothetical protein
MEGRPGDDPECGAQPFKTDELSKLREAAGPDLLAFLVLRWTGLTVRGGSRLFRMAESIAKIAAIPLGSES